MICPHCRLRRGRAVTVPVKREVFGATFDRPSTAPKAPAAFFAQVLQSSDRRLCRKGLYMAADHIKNLKRLREILRKQRRELVATMVGAKKEPTKFAPLVELQEACDAVEWALDDEAAAAKEGENNEP